MFFIKQVSLKVDLVKVVKYHCKNVNGPYNVAEETDSVLQDNIPPQGHVLVK
jgi:hypothetical protein